MLFYRKSLKNQLKLNRYDGHNILNFELSWELRVLYHLLFYQGFRNHIPIGEKRKPVRPAKAKQALIVHN
ncbi:hypothetical protein BpHYR1_039680 [Brachionus plicatilis]|uniref:Uncharacterized protein n=1 Tax=Brachionus plicatilis TaxID=10195 RepID=A0A3M7RD10_BRAPC|nr:hypothetical protein BpHYR1_039680 [Brachionus plicatilis]